MNTTVERENGNFSCKHINFVQVLHDKSIAVADKCQKVSLRHCKQLCIKDKMLLSVTDIRHGTLNALNCQNYSTMI